MSPAADLLSEPRLGRYVVHRQIASGGMATVHLGRLVGPAGFARTVAIKRLHSHLAKDPQFVSSFVDEARLAACVRHPNVASTLDVVEREEGILVVMEYVHGQSLAGLLRNVEGGRSPLPVVLAVSTQMLYGLHAAHEARSPKGEPLKLVHRDVSPQNVVVGTDGVTRLLDFGVAKATWRLQETRDGSLKGKIGYMAPEQIQWEAVDRRTDIFSASVVLWEALTGERLFAGEDAAATVKKILAGDAPKPSSRASTLPLGLDNVVLRGLAKSPDDRFPTALDMAVALEAFAPIATAREVGAWVSAVAGDVLAKRAEMVHELEQATVDVEVSSPSGPAERAALRAGAREEVTLPMEAGVGTVADLTRSALTASAAPTVPSSRWGRTVGAALVVASLGGVVFALRHGTASSGTPPAPVVPSAVAPPPSSSAAIPPPSAASPGPAPSVAAASPPSSASAARAPRPPLPRAPAGRSTAKACDPPYTVGPDGIRHFRPECI